MEFPNRRNYANRICAGSQSFAERLAGSLTNIKLIIRLPNDQKIFSIIDQQMILLNFTGDPSGVPYNRGYANATLPAKDCCPNRLRRLEISIEILQKIIRAFLIKLLLRKLL
jgi:hypothetical protein